MFFFDFDDKVNMASRERIKKIREVLGINQTELARRLSLSPSAISEFETGSRPPSKKFIFSLPNIGISVHWFLTGKGGILETNGLTSQPADAKSLHEKVDLSTNPPLPDTVAGGMIKPTSGKGGPPGASATEAGERNTMAVLEGTGAPIEALRDIARREIPVVVDGGIEQGLLIPVIAQGLSAGLGHDYDEGETIRYIKVPAWVARSGRDLVALPVYGDSMEPTISNGDLVVCDSGGFCGDGLYMLRDEDRGLMFCKRVVWAPNGWTIKSDNPSYESMKVDDNAIHIVARIIATVKGAK